ncbi:response regulator transcription factor [Treponema sp. OttesenSCG-928-L16]|nr:response regulator transcription factor [Treponema sp. OttesenSCG-928-L16]
MIRIVIIDDHPLVINGIGAWLAGTGRFEIAGTAGTLEEARVLMERLDPLPEIIILDISMGKEDGLGFIPELKELCAKRLKPPPGILVCSMYEDPFLVQRAVQTGANAYVAKSAEAEEIMHAIDTVLSGGNYIDSRLAEKLSGSKDFYSALTKREREIMALVRKNYSNRRIAESLGLELRTVENYLSRLYEKTGAKDRSELISL